MNQSADQNRLARKARRWAPTVGIVTLLVVIAAAFFFIAPGILMSMQRQAFRSYVTSVDRVLRLERKSESLARAASKAINPRTPESLAGRSELTAARQAAASALYDLRDIHPPAGTEQAHALLEEALVDWGKSLRAMESGFTERSTIGWIQAIGDNYERAAAARMGVSRAEKAFAERAKEAGLTFDEAAKVFGRTATDLAYAPPASATPTSKQIAYETRLRKAFAAYERSQADFRKAASELPAPRDEAPEAIGKPPAGKTAPGATAEAALAKMELATREAQTASDAIAKSNDPVDDKARAQAQAALTQGVRLMAFEVMPGYLRACREYLKAPTAAVTLVGGSAAGGSTAERKLRSARRTADLLIKQARAALPFLRTQSGT